MQDGKGSSWKLLPSLLSEGDTFDLSEDQAEVIVRSGSAHIFIGFGTDEEDEEVYLLIHSPLVFMPRDNLLPFYRKLLDLNNAETLLGRLAMAGDVVVLRCAYRLTVFPMKLLVAVLARCWPKRIFLMIFLSRNSE